MNHKFNPSNLNENKCQVCKWPESQHGDNAVCEACPKIGPVMPNPKNTMLLCKECWDKETSIIPVNEVLTEAKRIDESVTLRTDLFNAATKSIIDIKTAIDEDETIENKNYKLAEILKDRFSHFKTVVFEAQQTIIDASNNQKAIQVYLNNLANQLRQEERDKLKLQDINYKPATVKPAKTETTKRKPKKLDKAELRKVAAQYNMPEFLLQQIVVQKNFSIEDAAIFLKKQTEEMLAKQNEGN